VANAAPFSKNFDSPLAAAKTVFVTSPSAAESCGKNLRLPFGSFFSELENETDGICHTSNVLNTNHVKNKINSEQADHCNVFIPLSLAS
jgi:hypothetical protein